MKRFISLLLVLVLAFSTLALTSCDQDEIDKMYDDTKKTVAEIFEPFFKKNDTTETEDTSGSLEDGE